MKVMVCLKQVPHQDARLEVRADGSWIQEDNIKFEINSYDTYALEEALRMKDAGEAEVFVIIPRPRIENRGRHVHAGRFSCAGRNLQRYGVHHIIGRSARGGQGGGSGRVGIAKYGVQAQCGLEAHARPNTQVIGFWTNLQNSLTGKIDHRKCALSLLAAANMIQQQVREVQIQPQHESGGSIL